MALDQLPAIARTPRYRNHSSAYALRTRRIGKVGQSSPFTSVRELNRVDSLRPIFLGYSTESLSLSERTRSANEADLTPGRHSAAPVRSAQPACMEGNLSVRGGCLFCHRCSAGFHLSKPPISRSWLRSVVERCVETCPRLDVG